MHVDIPLVSPPNGEDIEDISRSLYMSMLYTSLVIASFDSNDDMIGDALHALETEAAKGDSIAKYYTGMAYFRNIAKTNLQEKGIDMLFEAMNAGIKDYDSFLEAIDCIRLGQYVKQDEKKAARMYRALAKIGAASGIFRLAYCYEWGIGVEKDRAKAEKLYAKAAKSGSKEAASKITADDIGQLRGEHPRKWRFLLHNAPVIMEI